MSEQGILCFIGLVFLAGLAVFTRREGRDWGNARSLSLLLALGAIPCVLLALSALLAGGAEFLGALLLVVSLGSLISGALARWSREVALLAPLALLLALPPTALALI